MTNSSLAAIRFQQVVDRLCLIDLYAAFDTIDRKTLLKRFSSGLEYIL